MKTLFISSLCFVFLLFPQIAFAKTIPIELEIPTMVILLEYTDRHFHSHYQLYGGDWILAEDYWHDVFFNQTNAFFSNALLPIKLVPISNTGVFRFRLDSHHPHTLCNVERLDEDVREVIRLFTSGLSARNVEELLIYVKIAGYESTTFVNAESSILPMVFGHARIGGMYTREGRLVQRTATIYGGKPVSWGLSGELQEMGIPLGMNVIVHEVLHLLGVPDVYEENEGKFFCVMGRGVWGARSGEIFGNSPSNLSAPFRFFLIQDFENQSMISEPGLWLDFNQIIKLPTDEYNMVYLMELRNLTGTDRGLYRWHRLNVPIVIIWQIDLTQQEPFLWRKSRGIEFQAIAIQNWLYVSFLDLVVGVDVFEREWGLFTRN